MSSSPSKSTQDPNEEDSNNDEDDNEPVVVQWSPPTHEPKFLRGKDANLHRRRRQPSSIQNPTNIFFQSYENEEIILSIPRVCTSLSNGFQNWIGELVITTRRILFSAIVKESSEEMEKSGKKARIAQEENCDQTDGERKELRKEEDDDDDEDGNINENDFSIDSSLICLHALSTSGPDPCVYLQLNIMINDEDGDEKQVEKKEEGEETEENYNIENTTDGNPTPVEIHFTPLDNETFTQQDLLQKLFSALSETAELNPPPPEDDDGGLGYEFGDVDDEDDDGFFFRPDNREEATDEQREAMLDRLNGMLEVPPHLEVEGQFDDAVEDDDLL